jgi:acyl-CoA synthetase (NDP forming)
MRREGPSTVTAIGVPACTARQDCQILVNNPLLLWFKNIPAGGSGPCRRAGGQILNRDLSRLLRPRAIAVIGGGSWCANVVRQCRDFGFAGDIWPVHPKKPELGGLKAFATLNDLPGIPDAAFVGVNRRLTVDMVRVLAELGCGGAVCFAAGFLEAQDEAGNAAELQAALVAAAGDMPILGPNCYGYVNYLDGAMLWPDQQGGQRVARGVAIVTQSSNIAINLTMQRRGLPLACLVTAGNQAQTGLAEIAAGLIRDGRVSAVGLYIEGIDDLRGYERLAAAAQKLGKPLVALKVGRSEAARAATQSHTASLAGSDAGAEALLERLNIARVDSLSEMLELLKLLHVTGPLKSNRIASLSCSGGEASLMADAGQAAGLVFPALKQEQKAALRKTLGPLVKLSNPLDYNTYIWNDIGAMSACFTAMAGGDSALTCVITDFPREDRCNNGDWDCVITSVRAAGKATGRPFAVLSTLAENMSEAQASALMAEGILPLAGLSEGISAIAKAAWLGRDRAAPAPLLLPALPERATGRDESTAKQALAAYGLAIPAAGRANSPQEAGRVAAGLGFPVVLKGEGLAHKTEAGAVKLDLTSAEAVVNAARSMNCAHYLVEQMVPGAVAELLVGVICDPAHGYVLTLGAGGTLTELMSDSFSLLIPASEDAVEVAMMQLRIAPLLSGYRGKPAADIPAIVSAIKAVQSYVEASAGRVAEVEINPLLCLPDGAVAVDALIIAGEEKDD